MSKTPTPNPLTECSGILPVNKSVGCTSFTHVSLLRKKTRIQKIGHAGTLDPFASGVMVLLIGRDYTRLCDQLLTTDKHYRATLQLGTTTDSYDIDGQILSTSELIPSLEAIEQALLSFQGECLQTPPMFSAKKVQGKKLYDLARKGVTIERESVKVHLQTTLLSYTYPHIELDISCSKGTYIRSIAQDLGQMLGCGAFLCQLTRTRSGQFDLSHCIDQADLMQADLTPFLRRSL